MLVSYSATNSVKITYGLVEVVWGYFKGIIWLMAIYQCCQAVIKKFQADFREIFWPILYDPVLLCCMVE